MNLYLLLIGRRIIENGFDFKRFSVMLSDKDYKVDKIFFADDGVSVNDLIDDIQEESLFVASGDLDALYDYFGEAGVNTYGYVRIGNRYYVPMPNFDEEIVRKTIIPLLNAKTKNSYNTVVIKTFGKSAAELKEAVKEFVKGRNKVFVEFFEDGLKCDVRIRYSKNLPSAAIQETILGIGAALKDCIYATKEISIAGQTADLLMRSGKRLSIAESFTGGGVASALIATPGMSNSLIESVVCYSNQSKVARLRVSETTLVNSGAVSEDTAYEMAVGLFENPKCEIAVATTGNAGPTSEKEGQVGLYYVAVGDRKTIHVFERFHKVENADKKSAEEIRQEITQAGIETALFELGKYLRTGEGE